jgi:hypothetical protein
MCRCSCSRLRIHTLSLRIWNVASNKSSLPPITRIMECSLCITVVSCESFANELIMNVMGISGVAFLSSPLRQNRALHTHHWLQGNVSIWENWCYTLLNILDIVSPPPSPETIYTPNSASRRLVVACCVCDLVPLGNNHCLEILALSHLSLDVGDDVGDIWHVLCTG